MNRRDRLRRAAIVSCHCLRYLAYYRAGWDDGNLIKSDEFWKTVNSNFIDICLLEWCKLFGNHNEKHHWKNIIKNKSKFKMHMLDELNVNEKELRKHWNKVKLYRDTFIAHLDLDEIMNIPNLDLVYATVVFYYNHIQRTAADNTIFSGLPNDIGKYYQDCLTESQTIYR